MTLIPNKLLAVSTEEGVNIGDYVQALAASQFYPSIDGFIEREKLNEYNEGDAKAIMNAWYMHNPNQWPPSPQIKPLFVAFHINSSVENEFLSEDSIAYLKHHEPIGCRDIRTTQLLQQSGVNAYFSGCLTLTLGEKYSTLEKDENIYFVDAYVSLPPNFLALAKILLLSIFVFGKIIHLYHKQTLRGRNFFISYLKVAHFYFEYSKAFTDDIILGATYITQQSIGIQKQYKTNKELLQYAEELVKKYATAKLVITSRIHCALPCLGLNTSVLYVHNENGREIDDCRLNGLLELFNVVKWRNHRIEYTGYAHKRIDKTTIISNKANWKPIADKLILTCKSFFI